jgi:hypothetical protein
MTEQAANTGLCANSPYTERRLSRYGKIKEVCNSCEGESQGFLSAQPYTTCSTTTTTINQSINQSQLFLPTATLLASETEHALDHSTESSCVDKIRVSAINDLPEQKEKQATAVCILKILAQNFRKGKIEVD